MADHQTTATDQPPELSDESQAALDMLLDIAGPEPEKQPPPQRVSATAEFEASRESRPRHGGRPGGEYPRPSTVATRHRRPDGTCSLCGDPWDRHWDNAARKYITGAEWHQRDAAVHIPTVQR